MRKLFSLVFLACLGCTGMARPPDGPAAAGASRADRFHQAMGMIRAAPEAFVNTLLPEPRATGPAATPIPQQAEPGPCLSAEQAYDLTLAREVRSGPRYQWTGARDGIEAFARAIAPIAAARHAARATAGRCMTEDAIERGAPRRAAQPAALAP